MNKQTVTSQSLKLQLSNKSKDASSSSNEVYWISESPLMRKTNKQIVLTSSGENLTSKFKEEHTKENKIQQSVASERK